MGMDIGRRQGDQEMMITHITQYTNSVHSNIFISKQRLKPMHSNSKLKACNGCDTFTSNLVLMPCHHRLCMSCIKSIKLPQHSMQPHSHTKQPSNCSACKHQDRNRISTSPDQVSYHAIHSKYIQNNKSPAKHVNFYEASPETRFPDSYSKLNKSIEMSKPNSQAMMCLEHNEILVMYSQRSKEFLCAQCFYQKQKVPNNSILPIKNALELISAQNRSNREQSRHCLNQVEAAMKVCSHNIRMLEKYETHFRELLRDEFKQLKRELERKQKEIQSSVKELLEERINQFNRIMGDLEYLKNSIKQYREHNKENQNVNTMIYVFQAYKMIKSTIKNLDMKYHQYTNTEMEIVKIDKEHYIHSLDTMCKIKHQLPIKSTTPPTYTQSLTKQRSHKLARSVYQQQPLRHNKNNSTQLNRLSQAKIKRKKDVSPNHHKKQQISLCNSQPSELESNLYERLINQKFNRLK